MEWFELEDVVPVNTERNTILPVLAELTPTDGDPVFWRFRGRVLGAWTIDRGLVVTIIWPVHAAYFREHELAPQVSDLVAGIYAIGDSDAVWRGSTTWLGQNLMTSDQFSSGHIVVVFPEGGVFECVGPMGLEYQVLDDHTSPERALFGLAEALASSPRGYPADELGWDRLPIGSLWLSSDYRDHRAERAPRSEDRFLPPGTRVTYRGGGVSEHGVVVHCWVDPETSLHDCYVAFFGEVAPEGKPDRKPYVLRYFAGSLTVVD